MAGKLLQQIGFGVLVVVQLYVASEAIWRREKILSEGIRYKMRVAPLDPTDPFRGKYIRLSFADELTQIPLALAAQAEQLKKMTYGQQLYVSLKADEAGFARVAAVSAHPVSGTSYFPVTSGYYYPEAQQISVSYSFDRFYMNEEKAKPAEKLYFDALRDSSVQQNTYAVVRVFNGEVVLEDVQVDGLSLADLIGED